LKNSNLNLVGTLLQKKFHKQSGNKLNYFFNLEKIAKKLKLAAQ